MAFNKGKVLESARKYAAKGQNDKAVKELLLVVREDPNDVRIWLELGDLQVKREAKREAIDAYLRAASFYEGQGFFLKSVAVYKQVHELDSQRVEVIAKLAEL